MSVLEIKEEIRNILKEHHIDAFDYCSAKDFDDVGREYNEKLAKGFACEFEIRETAEGIVKADSILEGAQSFLCVLLPHKPYNYRPNNRHGRMASGTASEDYHTILTRILGEVKEFLSTQGVDSVVIVDTTPLSDRGIAQRAGLGLLRRNNMFYHKKYGSYVHIGSLLMTMDLHERDVIKIKDPCGSCRKCVGNCPGAAIIGDGTINSHKCVSYLTQKKVLSSEEASVTGDMIYGCNVCQEVCPVNRGIDHTEEPLLVEQDVDLRALLNISNKEFKSTYGLTASGWRGKRTLQRNAINVLGNIGDESDQSLLEDYVHDSRPIIQEAARDAVKKIERHKNHKN